MPRSMPPSNTVVPRLRRVDQHHRLHTRIAFGGEFFFTMHSSFIFLQTLDRHRAITKSGGFVTVSGTVSCNRAGVRG